MEKEYTVENPYLSGCVPGDKNFFKGTFVKAKNVCVAQSNASQQKDNLIMMMKKSKK